MNIEKDFYRENVDFEQEWNGTKIHFDPDSSPKAWEHYKRFYTDSFWNNYYISEPRFLVFYKDEGLKTITAGCKKNGKWFNYADCVKQDNNRLFAITDTEFAEKLIDKEKVVFYQAQLRLGGDTDFNFNEQHIKFLQTKVNRLSQDKKKRGNELLQYCARMHHTLVNFSLMQSMGNLQRFKARYCNDRLDRFIYFLDKYYAAEISSRKKNCIITNSSTSNSEELIKFLNSFKDIWDYCKKVYFIDDREFIKLLITSSKKPKIDVLEYMELAKSFWNLKEKYFKERR